MADGVCILPFRCCFRMFLLQSASWRRELEMFVVKSRETIAHYPSFPLGPPWGETRNLILFLNGKAHRSFGLKNMERDLAGTK